MRYLPVAILALLLVAYATRAADDAGAPLDVRETPVGTVAAVVVETITPSPDGRRLAYAARQGDQLVLTVDGKPASKPYDGFGAGGIVFSPDSSRVAAMVSTPDGKWLLVVDGGAGEPFDVFAKDSLVFSPDSAHVAVVAGRGNKRLVVVDGVAGKEYDDVQGFAFAPADAASADAAPAAVDPVEGEPRPAPAAPDRADASPHSADAPKAKDEAGEDDAENSTGAKDPAGAKDAKSTDDAGDAIPAGAPAGPAAAATTAPAGKRPARYAYAARALANWTIVTEAGETGTSFSAIGDGPILFRPDGTGHVFAAAKTGSIFPPPATGRVPGSGDWFVEGWGERGFHDELPPAGMRFSPDGARLAYAARAGEAWQVLMDGKTPPDDGEGYGQVVPESLAWRADGSLAFAARTPGGWTVVEAGRPGPVFEELAFPPVLSADRKHLAYVGVRGGRHVVVAGGKEGPAYDEVMEPPVMSGEGRLAYVARRGARQFVVIDGTEGDAFDAVGRVAFSPDGRRVAYGAQQGNASVIRVDDRQTPAFSGFLPRSRLVFGEAGDTLHAQTFRGEQLSQVTVELPKAPGDAHVP